MTVFARPNGVTRFRELSEARQPLPSAELDNEFNTLVNFVNSIPGISALGANILYVDVSTGSVNTDISTYLEIFVVKTDATANTITVYDSTGKTIMLATSVVLTVKDESIHLILDGSDWKWI